MNKTVLTPLIPDILNIGRLASKAIMDVYARYHADPTAAATLLSQKSDASPLTLADLAAHDVICDGLARLTPHIPLVSEEDEASLTYRQGRGTFWLIDPLDGTREFIACNDEFTVNIALICDGVVVWGAVFAPALGQGFWGGTDYGAVREVGRRQTMIRVADAPADGAPVRVVASKSHLNQETADFIDGLGKAELVQAGSSLKFCRVAEGAAHYYPRLAPTCEWDTAAAQAVLEGAGGSVVDLAHRPLRYGKQELLNPYFIASHRPAGDDAVLVSDLPAAAFYATPSLLSCGSSLEPAQGDFRSFLLGTP